MYEDIIIPIFLFGGTAAVLWKFFDGRHKERMAMIEKGANPADFKSVKPFRLWNSNLKWGLLLVFEGIVLFAGEQLHFSEYETFGSVLIAGGLALILFYAIASRKNKEKQPDDK